MNRTLSIVVFACSAALAGCAGSAGSSTTARQFDPNRGPLGKADALGSCSSTNCDEQSPAGCWCDEDCTLYGDCCSDHTQVCEAPVSPSCGGVAGITCGDGEYCHYDQAQSCGEAEPMGVCQPTPEMCPALVAPVCGCDGHTYNNGCEAHRAGASVLHDGACGTTVSDGQMCGGLAGTGCPSGQYCHYDQSQSCGSGDQTGTCQPTPKACFDTVAPVCGCDNQTYTNVCYAAQAHASVLHEGGC